MGAVEKEGGRVRGIWGELVALGRLSKGLGKVAGEGKVKTDWSSSAAVVDRPAANMATARDRDQSQGK